MQLILVTGGAIRIGKAIALALARHGFAVAIQYNRSGEAAKDTAQELRALGVAAHCFKADLCQLDEVRNLIPAVAKDMGPLAGLINNASHFADDRLEALSEQSWNRHMTVNLEAPLFLARDFAAQLPQDRAGNIVNIVDQRVLRPNPRFFSYTLSKSALWAATTTMAQALAPRIRVNAVAPGPTLGNAYQSEADFEKERRATLLGGGAAPDEIAGAVVFILKSPAMTGQMIAIDGGQHLLWQTPDIGVT